MHKWFQGINISVLCSHLQALNSVLLSLYPSDALLVTNTDLFFEMPPGSVLLTGSITRGVVVVAVVVPGTEEMLWM